jgi:hypothetical protein
MDPLKLAAFGASLIQSAIDAIKAGRPDVTDAEVDAALTELDASDTRLTDAIERARQREAGG